MRVLFKSTEIADTIVDLIESVLVSKVETELQYPTLDASKRIFCFFAKYETVHDGFYAFSVVNAISIDFY